MSQEVQETESGATQPAQVEVQQPEYFNAEGQEPRQEEYEVAGHKEWPATAPTIQIVDKLRDQIKVECEKVDHPDARYTFEIGIPGYLRTSWEKREEAENLQDPSFTFEDLNDATTYAVRVTVHPANHDDSKPSRVSKEESVQTLTSQMDANVRNKRTIDRLTAEKETLQQQIQRLEEQLKASSSTKDQDLVALREENFLLKQELDGMKGRLEQAESCLKDSAQNAEEKDERLKELGNKVESWEESYSKCQDQMDTLKNEKDELEQQLRDVQQQKQDNEAKLEEQANCKVEDLHNRMKTLQEEISRMNKQKQDDNEQYEMLRQKMENLNSRFAQNEDEKNKANEATVERDYQIQQLSTELDHFKSENEALESKLEATELCGTNLRTWLISIAEQYHLETAEMSEEQVKVLIERRLARAFAQEEDLQASRKEKQRLEKQQFEDITSVAEEWKVNPDDLHRLTEIVNGGDEFIPIGKIVKTLKKMHGDPERSANELLGGPHF